MTSSNLGAHKSQQTLTGEVETGSWSLLSLPAELLMGELLASLFCCRHSHGMGSTLLTPVVNVHLLAVLKDTVCLLLGCPADDLFPLCYTVGQGLPNPRQGL